MERSGKELIILVDKAGLAAAGRSLLERCDRVAMTPDAILALEEEGLSFSTFDDIYGYRQFREDNLRMMDETEDLFRDLDRKYSASLEYPRAFTGNILWFLVFFANALYLSKVCRWAKNNYTKVHLAGSAKYDRPLRIDLDFSERGLAFCDFNRELASKVSMLRDVLSPDCYWSANAPQRGAGRPVGRQQLLFSARQTVKKPLVRARAFFEEHSGKDKDVIFVVRDSNEVNFVKRHMGDVALKKPLKRMLEDAFEGRLEKQDIECSFETEIRSFALKWFPEFEKRVLEAFEAYFEKAVRCLRAFMDKVEEAFKADSPKAVFYSFSPNRVYEDVLAYAANERNIPVFAFWHVGSHEKDKDIYAKYLESNENVKMDVLEVSKFYNLHLDRKSGRGKGILYFPGIFNSYNYKDLMVNVPDRALFEVTRDIVEVVGEFGAEMDIKIHPNDEEYNYTYFSNLLKAKGAGNIGILRGFPAEKIMKHYSLFIFDYAGTSLIPAAGVFDTPAILYITDDSVLREKAIPDLERKFHMARHRSDLVKHISLYVQGKLETKITGEHAFPAGEEAPCVKMAGYVKSVIDTVKT